MKIQCKYLFCQVKMAVCKVNISNGGKYFSVIWMWKTGSSELARTPPTFKDTFL